MHFEKQANTWYWICNRRVQGVKCSRGKFSIRDETVFDNSRLPIQAIVWMMWHFVHRLSEQQCKQYTNIGPKNNKTVVAWYAKGGYHRSHAQENPYQIRTDLILCTYEIRRFFEGGQKNDGILSRGVGDGCCRHPPW